MKIKVDFGRPIAQISDTAITFAADSPSGPVITPEVSQMLQSNFGNAVHDKIVDHIISELNTCIVKETMKVILVDDYTHSME